MAKNEKPQRTDAKKCRYLKFESIKPDSCSCRIYVLELYTTTHTPLFYHQDCRRYELTPITQSGTR